MAENDLNVVGEESKKPKCFVIMPFADPEGYENGHFEKVYEQIFKPAIEEAGYEPGRVDEESDSTLIHEKIFKNLINAPMVLCDLSAKNPNVLYELGIRHAFDKPVVLVQEAGQGRIFDIAGVTTIDYRKSRLYDEVLVDQKNIAKALIRTADTSNSCSIMRLVDTSPAVLDQDDKLSYEEQIKLMFGKINDRISDVEKKIGGKSDFRKMDPLENYGYDDARLEYLQDELIECTRLSRDVLKKLNEENGEIHIRKARYTLDRLNSAISEYKKANGKAGPNFQRALVAKNELEKFCYKVKAIGEK